jgi:hypothetical protein
MEVAKKMASSEKLALLPHSPPWFLLQAGSALCMLVRREHCRAYELPAYLKRA